MLFRRLSILRTWESSAWFTSSWRYRRLLTNQHVSSVNGIDIIQVRLGRNIPRDVITVVVKTGNQICIGHVLTRWEGFTASIDCHKSVSEVAGRVSVYPLKGRRSISGIGVMRWRSIKFSAKGSSGFALYLPQMLILSTNRQKSRKNLLFALLQGETVF